MKNKEYIIFCDESEKSGRYFSNFYGGLIVGSSSYEKINKALIEKKLELNINGEIKWSKVTLNYLEKYKHIIKTFFYYVKISEIKIRIMFTQNRNIPQNISIENKKNEYFLLYYQFIKHSFGLKYLPIEDYGVKLRLYFDEFPETKNKVDEFKKFILRLNEQDNFKYYSVNKFSNEYSLLPKFILSKENITEIHSHEHILAQCLDVVLGAMAFILNNKHKENFELANLKGNRTKAKEELYKFILSEINEIRPRFNVGITTGKDGNIINIWYHPYRHWRFLPKDFYIDNSKTKKYSFHST